MDERTAPAQASSTPAIAKIRRRRWSAEDDRTLTTLWKDGVEMDQAANQLDRSVAAVMQRLTLLGMQPPRDEAPYAQRPWTNSMIVRLNCEDGKQYITHSSDLPRLVGELFLSRCRPGVVPVSKWLEKYPPLSVAEFRPGAAKEELEMTLARMSAHGWANVRSSRFHDVNMQEPPPQLLRFQQNKPMDAGPKALASADATTAMDA